MLLTKELVAKGSAILSSAGAGGTGLYYGGHYMSSVHKGSKLLNLADKHKDSHIVFKVTREGLGSNDDFSGVFEHTDNGVTTWYGPTIDFADNQDSFVIKIVSTSLSSTNEMASEGGMQTLGSDVNIQCSLKFERENTTNKTIKQDH